MHNHSNGNELRILMQIKRISFSVVERQDSLRNQDKQQLGNGLMTFASVIEWQKDSMCIQFLSTYCLTQQIPKNSIKLSTLISRDLTNQQRGGKMENN